MGTLLGQGTVNYTDGTDTVDGRLDGHAVGGHRDHGQRRDGGAGHVAVLRPTARRWVDIPTTGLSNSNAMVLANGTALRFVGGGELERHAGRADGAHLRR